MSTTLYLIYDGDCLLCSNTALAMRIKKTAGSLELINARDKHPLVTEALEKGYDLNEGIVVKYHNVYYYGADAIHFLALMGSDSNFFNKLNGFLFKSKWFAHFCYPIFKSVRNVLLHLRKIPPLEAPKSQPLIERIFPESFQSIPEVLSHRYRSRSHSLDKIEMNGTMSIEISRAYKILSPLFRLGGALVPKPAQNIPVKVELISSQNSNQILMQRTFQYPNDETIQFSSLIIYLKKNILLELMRFRVGVKLKYTYDKNKITMDYAGYGLYIGKYVFPLPLGLLFGKFFATEEAISENIFKMRFTMQHVLFGKLFEYAGTFKIDSQS